jgi:small subunit ribosomal protein S10
VPKAPSKPKKAATSATSKKRAKVVKPKTVKAPKVSKTEEPIARLRIRVRAYESKVLDLSVKQIIDTALRYDAKVEGPIPLPTEIKKYTVNRAAFVYKNAREQFEMRIHKRLIDILNPTPKIIESLTNLSLPSGVNIDVKLI